MYKQLILASQSPRRRELMSILNIPYTVINANIEETINEEVPIEMAIEEIAYKKALYVFEKNPEAVVIGADTVVVVDGKVLGKPREPEIARDMLQLLSGRKHTVITGVCIMSPTRVDRFVSQTEVEFYDLTPAQIQAYVDSKEPMDKAGAYAIQGKGALFVKGIVGDFYTVIGLPIARVYQTLQQYL